MPEHSARAKTATRKAVDGWIAQTQKAIDSRKKELAKFEKLAPKTPSKWDDEMIPKLKEQITKLEKTKQYYADLKAKYEKEGLI